MKRLKAAATKAAARAAAAKTRVREAKATLKQARKLFKIEKKAAKQARRKAMAAVASATVRAAKPAVTAKLKPPVRKPDSAPKKIKPRRASSPRARNPVGTMRSAAEVAKSVIERLHAPPPILPPTPLIPAEPPLVRRAGEKAREENRDHDAQEKGREQP
jgi:hypothetical protein